jgi:hypothetical protein
MKPLLFTLIFYFLAATAGAQYCSSISIAIDPKTETETKAGTVKSRDGYSLLIQKETNPNLNKEPIYYLSLNATLSSAFFNSKINDKGKIELLLKDQTKLMLENAKCIYNPISSGFGVVFGSTITKEQLEILLINPIVTFNAFGFLQTSFNEKKQREQQIIASCLLND